MFSNSTRRFMKKILLTALSICLLSFNSFAKKPPTIVIETEYGNIEMVLYDNTPKHRDNFIKITKDGVLDSTLFHRIIPEFMIQGGDPNSKNAKAGEMLGAMLTTEHNLTFYQELMRSMRDAIASGGFAAFAAQFRQDYCA